MWQKIWNFCKWDLHNLGFAKIVQMGLWIQTYFKSVRYDTKKNSIQMHFKSSFNSNLPILQYDTMIVNAPDSTLIELNLMH